MTLEEEVIYRLQGKKILKCIHAVQDCYIEEYGTCPSCPVAPDNWKKNYHRREGQVMYRKYENEKSSL